MAPPQHDAHKTGTPSKFRLFAPILAGATLKERLIGCVGALIGICLTGLVCGFFLGMGLASFSVGAAFVSRWYPPQRQGKALGLYGAGTIGQSRPLCNWK